MISHQPVQNPSCLLRFDLVQIQGLRGCESTFHGTLGDFSKGYPLETAPVVLETEVVSDVVGDRFALTVWVGSEDDTLGVLGLALELLEDLSLPRIVSYLGSKPLSTSTPSSFFGRSRTCPTEAATSYSGPDIARSSWLWQGFDDDQLHVVPFRFISSSIPSSVFAISSANSSGPYCSESSV